MITELLSFDTLTHKKKIKKMYKRSKGLCWREQKKKKETLMMIFDTCMMINDDMYVVKVKQEKLVSGVRSCISAAALTLSH